MLRSYQEATRCLSCDSESVDITIETSTMMSPAQDKWTFVKCANCNLTYLHPRVHLSHLNRYYDASYIPYRGPSAWGKYARFVKGDLEKIDTRRVEIVKKYKSNPGLSILDVGCGKPSFLNQVHRQLSPSIATGIDFSDHGWIDGEYDHIDLHVTAPADYQTDQRYDVITMWHYLEHEYTPRTTLTHLHELLRPDGVVIIEVPDGSGYTAERYQHHWAGYHTPRHTTIYNPDTLTDMLNKSGYEVIDLHRYGTLDAYSLDWMSRMEQADIDWSASMESRFWGYVIGKIVRPRYYLQRSGMGFMHAVARVK